MAEACKGVRWGVEVRVDLAYGYLFDCCFKLLDVSCYDDDIRAFLRKLNRHAFAHAI